MTEPKRTASENWRRISFRIVFLACFSSFISPPLALTLGIFFGLMLSNPFPLETRRISQWLLQGSVVALGFGMNLHEVLKAGRSGFIYTALGITFALLVGLTLGKVFRVRGNSSYLITAGTAICGGSAIAAIAPILHADEEEMAVSLGTVFVLNSVALLIFPPLGHLLGLSQTQFGLWAALAVHDTSPFLLSRRGCKHLSSDVYSIFQISLSTGAARPYGNTFSDRQWHLSRDPPARRLASSCAGHSSLDRGRFDFSLLHPHGVDRPVTQTLSFAVVQKFGLVTTQPTEWAALHDFRAFWQSLRSCK